jgi:serine/threonine protein kinase
MNSRYALLSKLSSSLYGEIYLAKDKYVGNQVVVKLSSVPKTSNCLENPGTEIEILEKLRDGKQHDGHQYIIKLVEAFPSTVDGDDLLCMVMEYASGGDMLDKIIKCDERKKKMSFSRIRKYSLMMAKGVSFLHSRGIVHLDLSLENMLLTPQDEIRICDFGQAQEQRLFRAFSPRRGKVAYMAPEVFKYHSFDGCKADVWSLGVIFWSILSNGSLYDKPVTSDPHFAYVAQGKSGLKKLFEGSEISDIPDTCLDLLSHMLAISPSSRYTIEQVLSHPWLQNPKKVQKVSQVQIPTSGSISPTPSTSMSETSSPKSEPSSEASPSSRITSSHVTVATSGTRRLIVRLSSDSSFASSPLSSPNSSGSSSPIDVLNSNQILNSNQSLSSNSL